MDLSAIGAGRSRGSNEDLLAVEQAGGRRPTVLAKLDPWKAIPLVKPQLACRVVERSGFADVVELTSKAFAPRAFLPGDVGPVPGANFAHLPPNRPRRVELERRTDSGVPVPRSLFELRG